MKNKEILTISICGLTIRIDSPNGDFIIKDIEDYRTMTQLKENIDKVLNEYKQRMLTNKQI